MTGRPVQRIAHPAVVHAASPSRPLAGPFGPMRSAPQCTVRPHPLLPVLKSLSPWSQGPETRSDAKRRRSTYAAGGKSRIRACGRGRSDERGEMKTKAKSKNPKPKPPALADARLAVTTAEKGLRAAKETARAAKSALVAARKACRRADKAAKKARKQARRARKTVKTMVARQAKLKKRTVATRDSPTKPAPTATGRSITAAPVDTTNSEILGEHR